MARQAFYIEGVAEAQTAFKALPADVQAKSFLLVREIATYVATSTHAAASTRAEVFAAETIKATNASVSLGGGRRSGNMALGTEFGGRGKRTTQQFRAHRGRQGYFFWPAIRRESATIRKMWDDLVQEAIERASRG